MSLDDPEGREEGRKVIVAVGVAAARSQQQVLDGLERLFWHQMNRAGSLRWQPAELTWKGYTWHLSEEQTWKSSLAPVDQTLTSLLLHQLNRPVTNPRLHRLSRPGNLLTDFATAIGKVNLTKRTG